jgi:hypothetical protein
MTLDAERMKNSVRPGDVVVTDSSVVRAVERTEEYLIGVGYTRNSLTEELHVYQWDSIHQYYAREQDFDPWVLVQLKQTDSDEDVEKEDVDPESVEIDAEKLAEEIKEETES